MTVPYWVKDAIFYQIFPDRFANGDKTNDPPNVQPWGSKPNLWGFQGGDLRGIIQKFDYLLDLGINAIYLNPIFLSTSNHRYNINDYYKIDPKLGDMRDFHALVETAHANNVRVILDGVFNHCGRGFFAFADLLDNQEHSAYKDWFYVKRFPVDAFSPGKAEDYEAWWGFKSLPKLNISNPEVRDYIFNVAKYWLEQGIDGWRLDVPNEINDDAFWDEFRGIVKNLNPDAYLVGEIWEVDPHWVGDHHFDGLMHYPLRKAIVDLIKGKITATVFFKRLEDFARMYPEENLFSMYLPLSSHDIERIQTVLENHTDKVLLAMLMQFTMPGAPAIYYGDEIGLEGGKDPDNRRAFIWEREQWNRQIYAFVKQIVHFRKMDPSLRRGSFKQLYASDKQSCIAYARVLGDNKSLIVINASDVRRYLKIPVGDLWQDGRIVRNYLDHEEYIVSGDTLSVTAKPWKGYLIG